MNEQKLKNAIVACFACHKETLVSDKKLEDSVDAAKAFHEKLKNGRNRDLLVLAEKLLQNERYQIKMKLVKKHIELS